MGYSCNMVADLVREALIEQLKAGDGIKSTNAWRANGVEHFYEVGREQGDGAITGTVHKAVLCPDLNPPERSRKVGSFRIEPDGTITRFPTSTAQQRRAAEAQGKARFAERGPLIRYV